MRIAYLVADPGIGIFGTKGASVHAQEMIRAFRALGHEVTVYATKLGDRADRPDSAHVPADLADLPVLVFPVAGAKGAAERERQVVRTAERMAQSAGDGGADLIYERYSLFSAAGARAADLAASDHAPAPASGHWPPPASGRRRPRVVVEVNAPLLKEQAEYRSLHHTAEARDLTTTLFSAADLLSCVSAQVASWATERIDPTSTRRPAVVVTPNGVDTARFRPAAGRPADQGHADRPFRVGFVGTLKPWHGTEILLRAFAAALGADGDGPEDSGAPIGRGHWRLEILGAGPQRAQLTALAAQLQVTDRVTFHGAIPPEHVPGMLQQLDVAVAPYPAGEHYFSPLKVYEYLAAGLPVVASAIGELPELLAGAGLLVPPGDVDALATALSTLAADPARRARLGEHGRRVTVAQHSWINRARSVLREAGAEQLIAGEVVAP